MDRDEALRLLRGWPEGVEEWNRRREAVEPIPELRDADLSDTTLFGADLHRANLSRANLSRADLRDADLRDADLSDADLRDADLSYADLSDADLRKTDLHSADLHLANLSRAKLSYADLSHADLSSTDLSRIKLSFADLSDADLSSTNLSSTDLRGTNLSSTDLSGADLRDASCRWTVFADVDLSAAKNLDSVRHEGPSYLSTDTLIRSRGQIPESFLRGCGVPERWIELLPSLIGALNPIQFYSCFISYSSKDTPFAERLHADLQARGVRCWFAPEDLKIGAKIRVGIDESIRVHDKLLLVLSKHSVASDWVEQEVETAMEQERRQNRTVLFPIRLDDAVMRVDSGWPAHIKRTRNVGDFKRWKDHDAYQKAFARLLRDLQAVESVGKP